MFGNLNSVKTVTFELYFFSSQQLSWSLQFAPQVNYLQSAICSKHSHIAKYSNVILTIKLLLSPVKHLVSVYITFLWVTLQIRMTTVAGIRSQKIFRRSNGIGISIRFSYSWSFKFAKRSNQTVATSVIFCFHRLFSFPHYCLLW